MFVSRPELRQSRQSLAAQSDRLSRASYAASMHGPTHSVTSSTRRGRPRSRSRDHLNGTHVHSHRPGSRYVCVCFIFTFFQPFYYFCILTELLFFFVLLKIKKRYSHAGSTHTLNNYCDTSDNWTDHDMDIYMAKNATTRNGLVPL